MTIEQVIEIVKEVSPHPVTEDSRLDGLGLDSLEFLDLMVRLNIPDASISYNTVHDLQVATEQ